MNTKYKCLCCWHRCHSIFRRIFLQSLAFLRLKNPDGEIGRPIRFQRYTNFYEEKKITLVTNWPIFSSDLPTTRDGPLHWWHTPNTIIKLYSSRCSTTTKTTTTCAKTNFIAAFSSRIGWSCIGLHVKWKPNPISDSRRRLNHGRSNYWAADTKHAVSPVR